MTSLFPLFLHRRCEEAGRPRKSQQGVCRTSCHAAMSIAPSSSVLCLHCASEGERRVLVYNRRSAQGKSLCISIRSFNRLFLKKGTTPSSHTREATAQWHPHLKRKTRIRLPLIFWSRIYAIPTVSTTRPWIVQRALSGKVGTR